tara:strand:+ start:4744 stop:5748 length:1005 start_codon:yes stop_codon:yes gene_type:complete
VDGSRIQNALDRLDVRDYVSTHVGSIQAEIDNGEELRVICPFCDDHKGKMYINTVKRTVFCQKCRYGVGVGFVRFMSEAEGIPKHQMMMRLVQSSAYIGADVNSLLDSVMSTGEDADAPEDDLILKAHSIDLPDGSMQLFRGRNLHRLRAAERYLRGRLSEEQCTRDRFYVWRNRVLIPTHFAGEIVTWVARDLTGKSNRKYMTPTGVSQGLWIFGWDRIRNNDDVVIVEGCFDAYAVERAGYACGASFGKHLTDVQCDLLSRFGRITVLYDQDAIASSRESALRLERRGVDVRVGILRHGDPDSYTKDDLRSVIESAASPHSSEFIRQYLEAV